MWVIAVPCQPRDPGLSARRKSRSATAQCAGATASCGPTTHRGRCACCPPIRPPTSTCGQQILRVPPLPQLLRLRLALGRHGSQRDRMGVNARLMDPEVLAAARVRHLDGADTDL